jgi:hypothetical protein
MTTLSWLELLLFATVIVGALMYHFGHAMGKEQAELDEINRLRDRAIGACMARHPAGKRKDQSTHLRVVE